MSSQAQLCWSPILQHIQNSRSSLTPARGSELPTYLVNFEPRYVNLRMQNLLGISPGHSGWFSAWHKEVSISVLKQEHHCSPETASQQQTVLAAGAGIILNKTVNKHNILMWLWYCFWFNFFATRLDKGWYYFPGIELFIRETKIVGLFYALLCFEVSSQKRVCLEGNLFNTSQAALSHWYLLVQTLEWNWSESLLPRGNSLAQMPAWVCSLGLPGCRHWSGDKDSSNLPLYVL